MDCSRIDQIQTVKSDPQQPVIKSRSEITLAQIGFSDRFDISLGICRSTSRKFDEGATILHTNHQAKRKQKFLRVRYQGNITSNQVSWFAGEHSSSSCWLRLSKYFRKNG